MTEPAYRRSEAARNIRQSNHDRHTTGTSWEHPSASYTALSALSHPVSMSLHAFEQAVNPGMCTYVHGRMASDGSGDADEAVQHIRAAGLKHERAVTAVANSAAAKWQRGRFRGNCEPSTRETPLFDPESHRFWCGVPWLHDLPCQDGGAPHPRDAQGDDR
ncbi:hypothetical protein ACFU99_06170 [Streptomyces sp. NPDC057654]|uniref:hypothetical protein n=1 Tax=Streptomyces sp. NPDC057654 TaxID=3346196 RepID=UPI003688DFBF